MQWWGKCSLTLTLYSAVLFPIWHCWAGVIIKYDTFTSSASFLPSQMNWRKQLPNMASAYLVYTLAMASAHLCFSYVSVKNISTKNIAVLNTKITWTIIYGYLSIPVLLWEKHLKWLLTNSSNSPMFSPANIFCYMVFKWYKFYY